MRQTLPRLILLFVGAMPASIVLADAAPVDKIDSVEKLWEGIDPTALPLEIEVIKSWDEDDIHIDMIYFTGEIFEGEKTRVFGYLGRPKQVDGKVPGLLHIHGGGQTAYVEWARFWAKRGYVCLSFDFCGNTNLPTLGPEYRREYFTRWGKVKANMMANEGASLTQPSPRYNSWFHWMLAARRGLTLLQQQPDVDGDKLGIFGASVGGTLTWMVAGVDKRVTAAAPIYGCGWESYDFPPRPDLPVDEDKRLWRKCLAPETCAQRITCPIFLLSASNDAHGKIDMAFYSLERTSAPIHGAVFTANYNHHVEPEEAASLPLWMDLHLKGKGDPWPATPYIELSGAPTPQVRMAPANPDQVAKVDLYYCLSSNCTSNRFWRTIPNVRREDTMFVGDAPFFSVGDVFYVYGNVSYKSGCRVSSRMLKVPSIELPGAKPTLAHETLIDAMDDVTCWRYVPAYVDPHQDTSYFMPWTGAAGEKGFTLDRRMYEDYKNKMDYYFGTYKIGDVQFRRADAVPLLIDVLADAVPEKLIVRLSRREPGSYDHNYDFDATAALHDPKNASGPWITLRMEPSQFQLEGKTLPNWEYIEQFVLVGTSPPGKPPVFKRLRWQP